LWRDKRAYVGSLVAASTGAPRMGECLALRRSDIGEQSINIAHSYSRLDGLKETIGAVNKKYLVAAEEAKLEKPEIAIDRKGRNIAFHSWRHFFCSKSTQKISGEKVAKVSGHLSEAVFKKYADHIEDENVREVGNAIAEVFQNIIPFPLKQAV